MTNPEDEFNNWLNSFSGSVLCGNATLGNNSSGFNYSCGSSVSETVLFTLADECGNQITKEATFTIQDTTSPVWDVMPSDLIVNCGIDYQSAYETWLNSFSGTDNCSTAIITNDAPATISCPQSISVNFELADSCGNATMASATFTVEDTLGLSEVETKSIEMYPNPTGNYISFKGLDETSTMEIYNVLGKTVFNDRVQNSKVLQLNLNSGLYIVKIRVGSQQYTKKLVIK